MLYDKNTRSELVLTNIIIDNPIKTSLPSNFHDAWFHPDPETRKKWREVIAKEANDIKKRNVWRDLKKGERLVIQSD